MKKILLLTAAALAFLGLASSSFAAGWSFTADTPVSYTFDQPHVNKMSSSSGGFAAYDHRSTGNVSGSKVMLIAPFHVGVGYEDYTVRQTTTVGSPSGPCIGACGGTFKMNVRMVDVMVDIPMHYLNLGLGYGQGEADVDIALPAFVGTIKPIRHAGVTQAFVTVGIPLGERLDVHVGYHRVQVEEKDILNAGGGGGGGGTPDKLQASGDMLSAGLRLNF